MIKKKVAFFIYSLGSGGAERVLTTLANNFTSNYEVHIITIINTKSFYSLDPSIKKHYCRESEINKSNIISSIKLNFRLYIKLKAILQAERINLLVSFMTTSNVLGSLAAKTLKIPCIISERTNPYIDKPNFIWKNLVRYAFPKSDYIVVQSKLIKTYYEKIVSVNKIVILPNPLSTKLSHSKKIPSNRENIILNVGRLVKSKNQDLLIRAFSKINNKDWNLFFIGEGPMLSEYKKLVNELNQNENIKFINSTNDIATYYNKSKIFAFTSNYEGFPNALIEAMYFELACISTDCPSGPADLINHNKNGFLIPVGNQNMLEKYLVKLMNDNSLCTSFGKKGYKTALNFDEQNVANKWKDLVNKLLQD
jgi:GalNAc-alpha-(1->4)-GalNAc-alpha-(1->3)-diNAcBac-PP-undecaprenol alpha-1,4-N-acetyl-D-galactosaminyltransferase